MTPTATRIFEELRADLAIDELAALRASVAAHRDALNSAQRRNDLIAVDLAEKLAGALDGLLALAHTMQPELRRNVVGAARYFVSDRDEKPDHASPTGLDDDVAVFNHVVTTLGRTDLLIDDA